MTVAVMAAMVLVSSAMAQTIKGGPSGDDLCRVVNVGTVDDFGENHVTQIPFLQTILNLTRDEAGTLVAKIILSDRLLMQNNGCGDSKCRINVTAGIDGRLQYLGGLGVVSTVSFETGSAVGAQGAIKKTVNVNMSVLAKRIALYAAGNLKRTALLESYVIAMYGGSGAGMVNNCSFGKWDNIAPFEFDAGALGVGLAKQLSKGGKAREYNLINALLSGDESGVTNLLLSDPETKKIFDLAMNQIAQANTLAAAPTAFEQLSEVDRRASLVKMRSSEIVGSCLPGTIFLRGVLPTNCWTLNEEMDRKHLVGSEVERWDKAHPRWEQ